LLQIIEQITMCDSNAYLNHEGYTGNFTDISYKSRFNELSIVNLNLGYLI